LPKAALSFYDIREEFILQYSGFIEIFPALIVTLTAVFNSLLFQVLSEITHIKTSRKNAYE
jgi:hypothetical protein